jgi:hypothetical protein
MSIVESARIALGALTANKLRAVLTMLGIIIGVGAVIALLSVGHGFQEYISQQFGGWAPICSSSFRGNWSRVALTTVGASSAFSL